jgi:arginase family enzyme
MASPPVVLDIDGSVGVLPDALVLPMGNWQERIRFGCGMRVYREFAHALGNILPGAYGPVFLGSGDFHHLSYALIARLNPDRMIKVVVLDNHPDNMRFLFGIHCGSWVRRVAALPWVSHVDVLGITSDDVAAAHAWENYFTPLLRGKLTNWCIGVDVRWAARLGLARRFLAFDTAAELLDRFAETRRNDLVPTYLTIDKDVLSEGVVCTNWDQGCMSEAQVLETIALFQRRVIGSDVTGDVSTYRYRTRWKRWISAMDGQPDVSVAQLADWQRRHHALNRRLLDPLRACD